MISVKKYVYLLSCSDEEIDKEIRKMSEEDAKELLSKMIKFINQHNRESLKDMI